MTRALTLQIPPELYEPLLDQARRTGRTPEELVMGWLAAAVQRSEEDPLLRLAGTLESELTDVSARHDDYIGEGLAGDLRTNENG